MTPNRLAPHQKFWRNLKRAFRRPMPGYRAFQDVLRGGRGLEIGGPSKLFQRDLPIYRVIGALDGVNFASTTVWEGRLNEGRTFRYDKGRVGQQFILEATDLAGIADASYDFVVSCNNLEHVANPLRALREWARVVRPGGALLLVLPRRESNFDRHRDITGFEHLVDDFERCVDETDLTHLKEIVERHDYTMTPDTPTPEALRARGLLNAENRCLHHHVFDLALMERAVAHAGWTPQKRAQIPTDWILLATRT